MIKKLLLKIVFLGITIFTIMVLFLIVINYYVINKTKELIITENEALKIENIDCILVLGAGIWNDKPSPMLEDRINEGISLYEKNVSSTIIMSGDKGSNEHDEVSVMKNYALDKGVISDNILLDPAGYSTYDSIYRVKEIFQAKKIIIVTQKYHLHRALYIAKSLGIEAYGVASNPRTYVNQSKRDIREFFARNKDFVKCIYKPESKVMENITSIDDNITKAEKKENKENE